MERDAAKAVITDQRQQIYKLETELEEEKGKNLKLTAQLNHNYENSALPSSMAVKLHIIFPRKSTIVAN